MYADNMTESMQSAIDETNRRREIQEAYNKEHHIIPKTIVKDIREAIHGMDETVEQASSLVKKGKKASKKAKAELIKDIEAQMKAAAKVLDFEKAMELRDILIELKGENA